MGASEWEAIAQKRKAARVKVKDVVIESISKLGKDRYRLIVISDDGTKWELGYMAAENMFEENRHQIEQEARCIRVRGWIEKTKWRPIT